jgi:hypothetical protein
MGQISMSARRELVAAIIGRYRSSSRSEKGRILNELCAVTGWHRKHAVRALSRDRCEAKPPRARSRRYGEPVRDALVALWEASDRLCGKRLKVMIGSLLPALERHGRVRLSAEDRALVLAASSATIDRLLSEVRIAARSGPRHGGPRTPLPSSLEGSARIGGMVSAERSTAVRIPGASRCPGGER